MRITALTLFALTLVLSAPTFAAPLSQQAVSAARNAAAGIAGMAQQAHPTFNADGSIALDPKTGKPILTRAGAQDQTSALKWLDAKTGVSTVSSLNGPAASDVAGAQISGSSYADFSCEGSQPQTRTVLGRSVRLTGCEKAGAQITAVDLAVCDAALQGGVCDDAAYGQTKRYAVGKYFTVDDAQVGAGCDNASETCRVTIQASAMAAGTGTSLTTQAATKTAQAGSNSAQATFQSSYGSSTYQSEFTARGASLQQCIQANSASLNSAGVASTCDGQHQVSFGAPTDTSCTNQYTCAKQETRTTNYSLSCTRTFPLTSWQCPFKIPTRECTTTETPDGKTTSDCSAADIADGVLAHSTKSSPQCLVDGSVAPVGTAKCDAQRWTDYYAFPKKLESSGDCTATPSPLAGPSASSCSLDTRYADQKCAAGGWYGRTLSDQECIASTTSNGTTSVTELTEAEKKGCGVCVRPVYAYPCYAKPTANEPQDSCGVIPSGCHLASSTPQSTFGGLVLSQAETYECSKTETQCTQYTQTNSCMPTNLAQGMDNAATVVNANPAAMNQAVSNVAILDAINHGMENASNANAGEDGEPYVPLIFDGQNLKCRKPVGFISDALSNDCCRISLQRPGGGQPLNKCSLDEAKLAALRRANFTVYIGEYCSKEVGFGPFKVCVQRSQSYCAYPGTLPKIIQLQGRQQLAQMAALGNGASIQRTTTAFSYYHGNGGWAPADTVNGVTVVPWQYPSYCSDLATAQQKLMADPTANTCPQKLDQWFAVCDNPNGCGPLPQNPFSGSQAWVTQSVDPLKAETTALSRYAMASGACDTSSGECRYQISAWPAGGGGEAVVSKDIGFQLYSATQPSAQTVDAGDAINIPPQMPWMLSGQQDDGASHDKVDENGNVIHDDDDDGGPEQINYLAAVGNYVFRPHPVQAAAAPGTLPATIRMDYSTTGGQSWSSINLPTQITSADYFIPGTDIRVSGGCDAGKNTCDYHVAGSVRVTAKPWGSPRNPDCSGFTVGQISVLDFSKMNLSEWIQSVVNKVTGPSIGALAQQASEDAARFNQIYNTPGATASITSPAKYQSAKIAPRQGYGPFKATVTITGHWPITWGDPARDTDPVRSATVDWGDCTLQTQATPVAQIINGHTASGFTATHIYASPDQIPASCGGGQHNIHHTVTVKLFAASGVHTVTLDEMNVWSNPVEPVGTNEGAGGSSTADVLTAPLPHK